MNKKDYIIISIITLLFAVLVFYHLGSRAAPESAYIVSGERRDIILDFGEGAYISQLYIYSGPPEHQRFHVSVYDREYGVWGLLSEEADAHSVFTWNKIDLGQPLGHLGLVAQADRVYIMEMVAVDANGAVVTPRNAADYPGLFDEQELFSLPLSHTYWGQMYFDEIYHGRTAYEFIHGLTAYETTHPPLGKTLIAIGVRLFGMNPFGWRFMTAVFGIIMLPLIYAFAKALFDNTLAAAAAAVRLAADCMHFALSRIATIDIFAAFFILLMYYLMLKYIQTNSYLYLALCGLAMGLAVATKWTGVYAGVGLGLLFLWHLVHDRPARMGRLLAFCVVFFIIAPFLLYLASYRPFVSHAPDKGLWQTFIDNSQDMYNYHSDLEAKHYYSTKFHDWPTLRKPLLYVTTPLGENMTSSISCMGNPAVWWAGIPCVLFCFYRFLGERDGKAGYLAVAYLAQYLPWFFVTRITFIYHYFPASLFMVLMIAYVLHLIAEVRPWGKWPVFGYLAVAVVMFAVFYPVVSGLPFDRDYQLSLRWLEDWILVL
jgi:dolichyl-phosphate-mannose--protein O-mannosyl transferase